ncbi:(pine wood nematode) hypothetical protein [Aphelenchoides bicaudatus]|nr:(pine wood nematode) hypothetical protein [Aphelenchoides bicaudatus]
MQTFEKNKKRPDNLDSSPVMILLLLLIAFVTSLVHQFWYRRRDLPPGPMPLPIIGNMHQLYSYNRWEDKFLEWKNEYGPIYTYWLGPMPLVSVNTYSKAADLFVKDPDAFVDRAANEHFQGKLNGGVYGIFETTGPLWLEQRRFSLRVLRDFGLGKNKMQERILEEVETMLKHINSDIKMGIREHDLHMRTDIAAGSVINSVLLGFRFTTNGNEAKFYKLKKLTSEAMEAFTDPITLIAITSPNLSKVPPFRGAFQRSLNIMEEIHSSLEAYIEQHEEQLRDQNDDTEPRDFVDAYLLEQRRLDKQEAKHYFLLLNLMSDFWFAGQESTSSSLTWGIAFLIQNEDVQQKVHSELDKVIGSERFVTVEDKKALPYLNAVLLETLRAGNLVAQNVFHRATKDVHVDGMVIKKGMTCIPQISVFAIDPDNFKNPQQFDPSRFIDSNGELKRCDELAPFSLGKRACPGEGLARMELFLFMANLLNHFKFSAAKKRPTLKKLGGGAGFATEAYKCRIEARY